MSTISDEDLMARLPDVAIDHDNKEFYRGWLERKLLLNRCRACGTWHHVPKARCPECWSDDVVATEVSGRGEVYLVILLRQGPPAPDVDYAAEPHPVVTVDLEEQPGLRYTSTVVNCDPGEIALGMPVELTWIERYGVPFPVFQPANREES